MMFWMLLLACGGDTYIVEGTVVSVEGPTTVTIDHREVRGLMPAMVMPFKVADPALLEGVGPGARVVARLRLDGPTSVLEALRVTGQGDVPVPPSDRPLPLRPGETLAALDVPVAGGETVRLGKGQTNAVLVGFVYTRCPIPEACPAAVARMAAMEDALPPDTKARVLAITLDPAFDTLDVLSAWGDGIGTVNGRWDLGRLDASTTAALASQAALQVTDNGTTIEHGVRWLVLGPGGLLIERYDDHGWQLDRVYQQLLTGGPSAPPGSSGTLSPAL